MPALQNDANQTSAVRQEQQQQIQSTTEPETGSVEESQLASQNREITQTDRLNKVLLKAFLNRINNGEIDLTFQQQPTASSSSFDGDSTAENFN